VDEVKAAASLDLEGILRLVRPVSTSLDSEFHGTGARSPRSVSNSRGRPLGATRSSSRSSRSCMTPTGSATTPIHRTARAVPPWCVRSIYGGSV